MAQAKVNDYFTSKKRSGSSHAAKKRKIEIPFSSTDTVRSLRSRSRSDDGKKSPATNPLVPSDSESEPERDSVPTPTGMISSKTEGDGKRKIAVPLASIKLGAKDVKERKNSNSSFTNKTRARQSKTTLSRGQTKLTHLIRQSSSPNPSSDSGDDIDPNQQVTTGDKDTSLAAGSKSSDNAGIITELETCIIEEVTSVSDDHSHRGLATPRKRTIDIPEHEGPETRRRKTPVRKLISGKNQPNSPEGEQRHSSVKKKLNLLPESDAGPSKESSDEADKEVNDVISNKTDLLALVAEVIVPPVHAVSPLPLTPERREESSPSPELVTMTPKLQNLSQKLKSLSKMNGQALKNRLKQSGKIGDIKEQLGKLDTSLKAVEKVKEKGKAAEEISEAEVDKEVLPAHQRFEHLVEEGVPSLSLPFTYRLLENAFQAMETVVSMLHNRSEMCTFSKLRAAVQNITKKNFEEKTVGQIKTVVPDAYTFRQEKNIPAFGKKPAGYQMTVEANLEVEEGDGHRTEVPKTAEGKPTFNAASILKRQRHFRNSLVSQVKQHHKTFLSSLRPPIAVPDDKLTRWHPRFQLDKVPEIIPSPLPQPPEVKVYHTAKDVLEQQRGKLNPRVEEALAKVASENGAPKNKNNNSFSQSLNSSPSSSLSSSSSSSGSSTSSLKGIPPALLAKIRAKEAKKMEEALTRNPAEDNKTKIMSHLPEIIRILRAYFVTEKKPAIPLELVYKKLEESYRIGMSQRDVEQHINLLKELAPELVSVVEIKRGKFLKLDKNVDIQCITNRILGMVKERT